MYRRQLRLVVFVGLVTACSIAEPTRPRGPVAGDIVTDVSSISVSPRSVILSLGGTRALSAVAKNASDSIVTATITWQSSAPGVATVSSSGLITAVMRGKTNITAHSGLVTSALIPVTITDSTTWPTTGPTSDALIDAAIAASTITAEQGLVYKVFAAYVDHRLPVKYRGVPDASVDNPIVSHAASQFASMSPTSKAMIAPYFLSPGDPNSWYAQRYASVSASAATRASLTAGTDPYACQLLEAVFTPIKTAHFTIHYVKSDAYSQGVAQVLAPEVETVYATETAAFGRVPPSDGLVTGQGNGCDGQLDVWVMPDVRILGLVGNTDPRFGAIAWTTPYQKGCAPSPTFIGFWGTPWPDPKTIRNAFAHEFWHMLELGAYKRSAACVSEYYWLGEATGNWAMDLVYHNDQFEHPYAEGYTWSERLVPIDEPGKGVGTQGYSDFPFLQYLANKYTSTAVRAIWNATESNKSVESIVKSVDQHGGMQKVWPAFALAMWNDWAANNQADFHVWDSAEWGMKKAFGVADAGGLGPKSIAVDQKGARKKTFDLMTSMPANGSGRDFPRFSIHADYLKFTDPMVASVLYTNPLASASYPNLKIQAMVKINGVWRAAVDWTTRANKSFCRDLGSENIQELVLIYSNADGTRPSTPISIPYPPNVSTSNVGCARWKGSSTVKTVVDGPAGGTSVVTAVGLIFDRLRYPGYPEGSPGVEYFTNRSAVGTVTGNATGLCSVSSASGTTAALDGTLDINLDDQVFGPLFPAPDRKVTAGTGSTTLSTTTTLCGVTSTGPQSWSWMEIPVPGYFVSADGRSIKDSVVVTSPSGTKTIIWKLTAAKIP